MNYKIIELNDTQVEILKIVSMNMIKSMQYIKFQVV